MSAFDTEFEVTIQLSRRFERVGQVRDRQVHTVSWPLAGQTFNLVIGQF